LFDLRVKLGEGWHHDNGVFVIGTAWKEDSLLKGESFAAYFNSVGDWHEFVQRIKRLNGFFSVVIKRSNEFYAAVDFVRSYPLFYSLKGGVMWLSDDPYWIRQKLGEAELDPVAAAELLLAGYVTGRETLDPKIAQLQAGEILIGKSTESGVIVETVSYYRFCHHDPLAVEVDQLLKMHDNAVQAAVQRLICFANGRLIAIPLSGGLDSRLIAMTIKRIGYDNVCAFSYGLPGNVEAEISRTVAREIGIPWYFAPYNRDAWAKWHTSKEWGDYIRFAERLTSMAHLQDWPAMMQLRAEGVLGKQTVIAPGHSADFLAGKQIPQALLKQAFRGLPSDAVANAVWKRHYNLRSISWTARFLGLDKRQLYKKIWKRIKSHFQGFDLQTPEGRIDAFDYEFWQEWLSKVIVNSMRVYEFWGLDWWLPWYDAEYVGFWERIPIEHRLHKALYNRYVKTIQRELGITVGAFGPSVPKKVVKSCISRMGMWELVYKLYWRINRRRRDYFAHPLGLYGIVDYNTYSQLLREGGNCNTLITLEQVKNNLLSIDMRSSHPKDPVERPNNNV